jgi:hypothetical protein
MRIRPEEITLFLLTSVTVLVGCTDFGCTNEAPAEHLSPDGQWKYVSFDRNCGATTGTNLQISILPASKPLSRGAANMFIADDDHGATRFVAQPGWLSNRKLRIAYSPKARIFKKETKVGPIEIEYMQEP